MAWGTSIWGVHVWGGGPGAQNLSFEDPDASGRQGRADQWFVNQLAQEEAWGAFDDQTNTWDPQEDFERGWRMALLVHQTPDTTNTVTSPAATDLASAITLLNELQPKFRAHLALVSNVHLTADTQNPTYIPDATDLTSAMILAGALKQSLNYHLWMFRSVHRKWDIFTVTAADAVDLTTTIELANALKLGFNNHIARTGYGPTNTDALFSFADSDLASPGFADSKPVEDFGSGWAIPDMLPLDYPAPPDRQECQDDLVEVDDPQVVPWPGNHFQLLDTLEYVPAEHSPTETFGRDWYMPGSITSFPNQMFIERYWDGSQFRFTSLQLFAGLDEGFEEGWRDNEEGVQKYWDPVEQEWRFQVTAVPPTRQLMVGGMGEDVVTDHEDEGGIDSYGFMSFDIGNPPASTYADALPTELGYSPNVCARVISGGGLGGPAIIQVDFTNGDGGSSTCYIVLDGTEAEGEYVFECFAETASLTVERHAFWEKWGGMKQITGASLISGSTGKVTVRGHRGCVETFDQADWTLVLE